MADFPYNAYRFATNPRHQTVRLARVRIWLEDPLTGESTGRSREEVVDLLSQCSRIENYSITHFLDSAQNYYDDLDIMALERTPGRRPYKDDPYHEVGYGADAPRALEVRVAFKERCHAPTVDYLRRLLKVRRRDIVFLNRRYLRNLSWAELVYQWLSTYDTDTDMDDRVTLKPVVQPKTLVPTSFKEVDPDDDPRMPRLMVGDTVLSELGRPPRMTGVDPYDLDWETLTRLTMAKPTGYGFWFIDPRYLYDKTTRDVDHEGAPLLGSAIVRQDQLGHIGNIRVDWDLRIPRRTYIMESGNGMIYQLCGRWARILECRPDKIVRADYKERTRAGDELAQAELEVLQQTRAGITAMPFPLLVGLYPWAFEGVRATSANGRKLPADAKANRALLFASSLQLLEEIYRDRDVDARRYPIPQFHFDRDVNRSLVHTPDVLDNQPLVAEQQVQYNMTSPEAFAEAKKHIHDFPDYAYGICESPEVYATLYHYD